MQVYRLGGLLHSAENCAMDDGQFSRIRNPGVFVKSPNFGVRVSQLKPPGAYRNEHTRRVRNVQNATGLITKIRF